MLLGPQRAAVAVAVAYDGLGRLTPAPEVLPVRDELGRLEGSDLVSGAGKGWSPARAGHHRPLLHRPLSSFCAPRGHNLYGAHTFWVARRFTMPTRPAGCTERSVLRPAGDSRPSRPSAPAPVAVRAPRTNP